VAVGAVLFDLYGTLADIEVDEHAIAPWVRLAELLERSDGMTEPARLRERFFQLSAEIAAVRGKGRVIPTVFEQLLVEHGAPSDEAAVAMFARTFRRASTVTLSRRPYAYALLRRLRAQPLRLGLVSNTEAILTHEDLDQLGLRALFDAIVLSSEVGAEKPEPEILRIALRQLVDATASAVMVGDTWETDVLGATRAGMSAIHLDRARAPGTWIRDSGRVIRAHPDEAAILGALRAAGVPVRLAAASDPGRD
jgi:putative hydrolase of the HAD superfamily